MTAGAFPLAFVAGVLSILSPCVLPILPIVLGGAASEHRWGSAALAAGLSVSFVVIGLFAATIGYSLGLDAGLFRNTAAVLMIIIGAVLLVPRFQTQLALAGAPLANLSDRYISMTRQSGLSGQMLTGVLLGAVWSPCVGPTLGAASLLAAQGRDLAQVTLAMFAFGLGAALPLLVLGMLSRDFALRWRNQMLSAGFGMKIAFGLLFVTIGMLVLSGYDKRVEATLVDASPQWLTNLTTRF
ncbi:MAG: cytochrome c biogenesis protein CcdA [Hyphomicrobiales bacterium]|nr:cytochrome c biogenesis protein CcdA [Hyphomicrobiales bacterium]